MRSRPDQRTHRVREEGGRIRRAAVFAHRNTGATTPQQSRATTRTHRRDLSVKIDPSSDIGGFVDDA